MNIVKTEMLTFAEVACYFNQGTMTAADVLEDMFTDGRDTEVSYQEIDDALNQFHYGY